MKAYIYIRFLEIVAGFFIGLATTGAVYGIIQLLENPLANWQIGLIWMAYSVCCAIIAWVAHHMSHLSHAKKLMSDAAAATKEAQK